MTPVPAEIVTLKPLEQECLEQAWFDDKEKQRRLETELRKPERRQQEPPGCDSCLRHDARFPDSAGEDAGAGTRNDQLSLDGDETPVS